ncbi:MAG: EamA family transporter [Clostridiales bacterium]|nr:EamA family transporter [Clostridiales bacterium]
MEIWVLLVILYGILKGLRDLFKKKALEKSEVMEVLFFFSLLAFLFVTPSAKEAFKLDMSYIGFIALKTFFVFSAWICDFRAIKKIPVSLYGVLDLSGVLFSTFMGVGLLNESLSVNQIIGLCIVLIGLFLVNYQKNETGEKAKPKYVIMAVLSCVLNASSGVMDKVLMQHMESAQLQFWFMFLMLVFYGLYIIVTRTKISLKSVYKNYWILLIALTLVIGDRALFYANAAEGSSVSAMTLIKQSACFITILGGRFIFKEENILKRLLCAALILFGIVISVI